jgi:hypothetical protein
MMNENAIYNFNKKIQIFINVKIVYRNGNCEFFPIVVLTKKGVFFGHFKKGKSFVEEGFIHRINIGEIKGEIVKKDYKIIIFLSYFL